MEFVVLLSVFAITLTQVIARSIDTEEHSTTKDGFIGITDDVKGLKFKLPTVLQHKLSITITGTLDLTEQSFTAVFPIEEGDVRQACTINFNYKSNSIIEASSETKEKEEYEIIFNENQEPEFTLDLEARVKDNSNELEITFDGNQSGPSTPVSCKIKSFEELGHIHFKEGVKRIKSILFMF